MYFCGVMKSGLIFYGLGCFWESFVETASSILQLQDGYLIMKVLKFHAKQKKNKYFNFDRKIWLERTSK